MKPNEQKPLIIVNECDALFDEKELKEAILWYSNINLKQKRKVYCHDRYPKVTINNEKIYVHRLLMMYWKDRELQESEYVHHLNENKMDARRTNLEIVKPNKHAKNHLSGDQLSKSVRDKMSESSGEGVKRQKDELKINTNRKGENNGKQKLNNEKVKRIRKEYSNEKTQYELADKYGISQQTVSSIVRRKTWCHI